MEKDAAISECGNYRYSLLRQWGDGASCVFIMLNPSTADADLDDPTIRRCIGFAKRENCDAIEVVNLFAFRSSDPKELEKAHDPVGPLNNQYIHTAVQNARGPIIAAWGACPYVRGRDKGTIDVVRFERGHIHCLGKTKNGSPRHPLYVPGDQPLIEL